MFTTSSMSARFALSLSVATLTFLSTIRESMAQAAPITISVNTNNIIATTDQYRFGINGYEAMDVNLITTSYLSGMNQIGSRFWRLHNGSMMTPSSNADNNGFKYGWLLNDPNTTPASQVQWDSQKISALLQKIPADVQIMIDIVNWPSAWALQAGVSYPLGPNGQPVTYSQGDPHVGRLNPQYYGAYSNLCANLVKIVQPIRRVNYWEILNEVDHLYWTWMSHTNVDLNSIATIYNQSVTAMKAVDPTIFTGGPAVQNAIDTAHQFGYYNNKQWTPGLVSLFMPNLDFYTFHLYDHEDYSFGDTDQQLFQTTRNNLSIVQAEVQGVANCVANSANPSKTIPVIWDENNINGATYNPNQCTAVIPNAKVGKPDPRCNTNVGAVCDAIVNIEALRAGVARMASFCDGPAWYGHLQSAAKGSSSDTPLPNGYVQGLFNSLFVGKIFQTQSSDESQVMAIGCTGANGTSILLVNENASPTTVTFQLPKTGGGNLTVTEYIVDALSYRTQQMKFQTILQSGLTLTPESVTVINLSK